MQRDLILSIIIGALATCLPFWEWSNTFEPMTIEDVSNLTGIPETSVRAGILYGWLPIGVAVHNGQQVKGPCKGRVNFVIYPKKLWEVTGHIWRGKNT